MKEIVLISAVLLSACTDSESVKHYAEIEGWESFEVTGYKPLSCDKDDFYRTGFVATKNGKTFKGTVCKGLFWRGAILRLE